jgi:glycogen operon protein
VEGPTDDREVIELRNRRRRSLITTLLVSQGIPMLLGGDELGRTQGGNNNAYCQDNEVSWFDWEAADPGFVEFVASLARLRRRHPTFRRPAWLHEHPDPGGDHVGWFTPQGRDMTPERWRAGDARTVTLYLDGAAIHTPNGVLTDDDFLLMFNGSSEAVTFHVPPEVEDGGWTVEVDTGRPTHRRMVRRSLTLAGYGMAVLRRRRG